MSSQRSCASMVLQVPSVIESPKATTALDDGDEAETSIDFSHQSDVVVPLNGARLSSAVASPAPSALRYDVTAAAVCWLGRTFAPGTNKLTATSCWARTG